MIVCGFCKTSIPNDSVYCPECGKLLALYKEPSSIEKQVTTTHQKTTVANATSANTIPQKASPKKKKSLPSSAILCTILAFVVLIMLLVINQYLTTKNDNKTSSYSTNTTNNNHNQSSNSTSSGKVSNDKDDNLVPYSVYNGKIIINPTYDKVCPLQINTETGSNYYIYLQYVGAPLFSAESRSGHLGESDMAFYVVGGNSVEVEVPIGRYKLFYATGDTFYGTEDLFGNSRTYSSDDYLSFYVSESGNYYYYEGCELTLYLVENGNFDTDPINVNEFPTR